MKITIIGLGLMGGSLGLALRRGKVAKEIVGHDKHHEAARKARQLGAVDNAEWNLPAAVDQADLVILATPVGEIEGLFGHIAAHLKPGCVVSDVASTKQQVMDWAAGLLPEHVSFVGGHPMAGMERSGVEAAHADLFVGSTYCIIPSPNARPEAIDLLISLVSTIGARPFFVDALEHDSFVAAVSHLPFIAAAGLVNTAASSTVWQDMGKLAASGFRDTSRLASGDPTMHRDICLTNRESIIRWLDVYIGQLAEMRDLIANTNDDAKLAEAFRKAKAARDAWLGRDDTPTSPTIPGGGEQIKQIFFGNLTANRRADPKK